MAKPASQKPAPQKGAAARKSKAAEPGRPQRTPLLEWISAGIGLLCVLAAAGVLVAEVLHGDDSPAKIVIRPTGVVALEEGFLMTIEVANTGGSPAATVVIEGALDDGGTPAQRSEATFDFIADHSTASGGLFFTHDPRRSHLVLRATGYADP